VLQLEQLEQFSNFFLTILQRENETGINGANVTFSKTCMWLLHDIENSKSM